MLQPDLENHIAVVTGAGSGIGAAVTLALAQKGAWVCLVDRSEQALDKVASQIALYRLVFRLSKPILPKMIR